MKSEGNTLQDFDLVVQSFTQAVGFSIFPTVLYISAPVPYSAGSRVDFFYFRSGVLSDPFRQVFMLDRVGGRHQDFMKELEGFVGFQQIRSNFKGIAKLLEIVLTAGSPGFLLVKFFRLKQTGNALDFPEAFRIADIVEPALITQADIIHHVIETFDDMERINTDLRIGESLFCNGYKAVAHITAEISDLFPLFERELSEVPV